MALTTLPGGGSPVWRLPEGGVLEGGVLEGGVLVKNVHKSVRLLAT